MHDTAHVAPENKYTRASIYHGVVTSPPPKTSQRSNVTVSTSSKLGYNNISTARHYHHFTRLDKSPAITHQLN